MHNQLNPLLEELDRKKLDTTVLRLSEYRSQLREEREILDALTFVEAQIPHRRNPREELIYHARQALNLQKKKHFSDAYSALVQCRSTLLSHPDNFSQHETLELLAHIDGLRKECQDSMEC